MSNWKYSFPPHPTQQQERERERERVREIGEREREREDRFDEFFYIPLRFDSVGLWRENRTLSRFTNSLLLSSFFVWSMNIK
jgi:hypothetical protein